LRALTGAAPLAGRNFVAIGGDSMNINTVYRDADIAWNVRTLPVPFVFFAHQNPVAWEEVRQSVKRQSAERKASDSSRSTELLPPNGTDDVLLPASLVRRLAEAAFQQSVLLSSADALADRLRGRQPAYFDPSGDRQGGRGEFVCGPKSWTRRARPRKSWPPRRSTYGRGARSPRPAGSSSSAW
jgi:hypothetical protein